MKITTLSQRLYAVTLGLLLGVAGAWADGVNLLQYITACDASTNTQVETGSKTYPAITKDGDAILFTTHENYLKLNLPNINVPIGKGQVYLAVEICDASEGGNWKRVTFDLTGSTDGTKTSFQINKNTCHAKLTNISTYNEKNISLYVYPLIDESSDLFDKYYNNESLTMTSFSMECHALTADFNTRINRVGFYTFGELATLYPAYQSKYPRFNVIGGLSMGMWGTANHKIDLYDGNPNLKTDEDVEKADNAKALKLMAMRLFAIGELPTISGVTWTVNLCPRLINSDQIKSYGGATYITQDVFLTKNGVVYEIPRGAHRYLPTVTNGITRMSWWSHYDYKDGINPNGYTASGNQSRYLFDYTRSFVEGYSTCIMPFAINASDLPPALSAYTFSSATTEGQAIFTKATGVIAANTPMIIKCTTAGLYVIPGKDTGSSTAPTVDNYYETVESNGVKFVGSFVQKDPTSDFSAFDCYGISADGTKLVKMAGAQTSFYRAFLAVTKSGSARTMSIGFDDNNETTGIKSMDNEQWTMDNVFDLQGRRISQPQKGLYIVNGKKVIFK